MLFHRPTLALQLFLVIYYRWLLLLNKAFTVLRCSLFFFFFFKSLGDLSLQKRTLESLDIWRGRKMLNSIIPIIKLSKDSIYYWTLLDFNLFDQIVEGIWSLKHNVLHWPNGNNIDFYILVLLFLYFLFEFDFYSWEKKLPCRKRNSLVSVIQINILLKHFVSYAARISLVYLLITCILML